MFLGGRKFELDRAVFHYGLSPNQLAVYAYLKSCAGRRAACRVKVKTIASACGCSDSTVRRALKALKNCGFIDIKGDVQKLKGGGHRQTCNRYYLLDESEWQVARPA